MVSQVDILLLQGTTQPEAQRQRVSSVQRQRPPPARCTTSTTPFRSHSFLNPPLPGRKFWAQRADGKGGGPSATATPTVTMKCLVVTNWNLRKKMEDQLSRNEYAGFKTSYRNPDWLVSAFNSNRRLCRVILLLCRGEKCSDRRWSEWAEPTGKLCFT